MSGVLTSQSLISGKEISLSYIPELSLFKKDIKVYRFDKLTLVEAENIGVSLFLFEMKFSGFVYHWGFCCCY